MKHSYIAPSLLAADKNHLLDEIHLVERLGAEYLHFDVMDGKFVPNVSFSLADFKQIAKEHSMINDVHIMIENPLEMGPLFALDGADIVTFHYEALHSKKEILDTISAIKEYGCDVGISIKPNTNVAVLDEFLDKIDLVLIMSVEPGKGGQKFMLNALEKLKYLRTEIEKRHLNVLLEVDGGINGETGPLARQAGADILVAGTYLFGHDDIKERIKSLR